MFGIWNTNTLKSSDHYSRPSVSKKSSHSLVLGQGVTPKKKRRPLPNIFSKTKTAEGAANFLKRFMPYATPASDSSQLRSPANSVDGSLNLEDSAGPMSPETLPIDYAAKLFECSSLGSEGSGSVVNANSKKVYYDSTSPVKWPQVEISLSPKKCSVQPTCKESGAGTGVGCKRGPLWEEVENGGPMEDKALQGAELVGHLPGQTSTQYSVEIQIRNGMSFTIKSHDNPNLPFKINSSHTTDSPVATEISTEATVFEVTPSNSNCHAIVVKVASSNPAEKMKEIQLILERALDTSLDPISKGIVQPTRSIHDGHIQHLALTESTDTGDTTTIEVQQALRVVLKKSLLFLPFPNAPFKVTILQPAGARFRVTYSETMIPIVTTAGVLFEARLQDITNVTTEERAFRDSPSGFKCTIAVHSSHPLEKFEEIKESLRLLSDSYDIGVPCDGLDESSSLQDSVQQCTPETSESQKHGDGLASPLTSTFPSVEGEAIAGCSHTTTAQATPPRRATLRKIKRVNFNEQPSPKRLYRPSGPEDRKYLSRRLNAKHFINDISGMPVVVLERLSAETIKHYLSS